VLERGRIGDRVGPWVLMGRKGTTRIVLLRCDCGAAIERHASTLLKQVQRAQRRVPLYCGPDCGLKKASAHLQALSHNAKKRRIAVELDVMDVFMLRVGLCTYCGGGLPLYGGGLDRKDSSLGYVVGNVVPCCYDCNTAKGSTLSHDEFQAAMSVRIAKVGRGNCWPKPV
jgi:hypothetical protein